MQDYTDDTTLFALLKKQLFTAVVGDVMDTLGFRNQFLPAGIMPLNKRIKLAGRAMPVLEADIFDDGEHQSSGPLAQKRFGLMLEALDDLKPNEVYVTAGGSLRYAMFGELMATRARHLKAAGAVLNGYARDALGIETLEFPVFCRGEYAQDQGPRGKVIDFRCAVEIAGVRIDPGTLLFGDREGVLLIPRQAEQEVIRMALEKVSAENKVGDAIRNGMGAVAAFQKYGVM